MRNRFNKLVALILVFIMTVSGALEGNMIISLAATWTTGGIVEVVSGETVTDGYEITYVDGNPTTLNVRDGGVIQGGITVNGDCGTTTTINIESGATVSGNVMFNYTADSGNESLMAVELNNAGTINGMVIIEQNCSLVNSGYMSGLGVQSGSVTINDGSAFGTLQVIGSAVINGEINADTMTIASTANVQTSGATIKVSSGLTVSGTISNDLTFVIGDTTTVNTLNLTAGSTITVNYEGADYVVPAGLEDITISLLGRYSQSSMVAQFGNLYVGYEDYDVVEPQTVTFENIGEADFMFSCTTGSTAFDLTYKKGDTAVASNLTLKKGEIVFVTIAPKDGLEAGNYSESINFKVGHVVSYVQASVSVAEKEDGVSSVSVDDYYYGGTQSSPVITSDVRDTTTVMYDFYSKDDVENPLDAQPSDVGDYIVKATFPSTYEYNQVTVQDEFSVLYMEVPENPVSFSGEKKNETGYYTSDITVTPTAGYKIAKELDGEYNDSIVYSESVNSLILYFMNITTKAKSDAYEIQSGLSIDKVFPVIDAIDGETYYGNTKVVNISDDNLATITVNDTVQTIETGETSVSLELSSEDATEIDDDGTEEYVIIAADIAGNETKRTIIVAKEWTKYVYSISKTMVDLGEVYVEYFDVPSATVTVTNIGDEPIPIEALMSSSDFDMIGRNQDVVASGGVVLENSDTYDVTVTPKNDLTIGEHTGDIQFDLNGKVVTVPVSFNVIDKLDGYATVTVDDFYYGETPKQPVLESETNDTTDVIVDYCKLDSTGEIIESEITSVMPTEIGKYEVMAVFPGNETYKDVFATDVFTISNMPVTEDMVSFSGEKINDSGYFISDVTVSAKDGYLMTAEADGEYKKSFTYTSSTEDLVLYFKNASTGALSAEYNAGDINIDTTVPEIKGITNGETYYADKVTVNVSDDNLAFVFLNGEAVAIPQGSQSMDIELNYEGDKTQYLLVVEDIAGHVAEVTVTVDKDDDLDINKSTPVIDGIVDGATYYGQKITAVISDDNLASITVNGKVLDIPQGESAVEVELTYDGKKTEYRLEAENMAGNVTRVTVFVDKYEGTGTVNMEDFYYGETPEAPVIISQTNGTENVVVEYRKTGADFTKDIPVEEGNYQVRVIFPETDKYKALEVVDTFNISYMPVPLNPITIYGIRGNAGYYTSDVTIRAKEGYLLSGSLNGTYTESIIFEETSDDIKLYFMDALTGAKSAAYAISLIQIDSDMPNTDDIEDGETYFSDELIINLNDNDLRFVRVNGELAQIKDGQVIITLLSNGGMEEYIIVAEDMAGNAVTYTIKVCADWMKNMIIPDGKKVKLERNTSYKLDSGSWKVSGDNTTYTGGNSIYVVNDGSYTFQKE